MRRVAACLLLLPTWASAAEPLITYVQGDRVEYRADDSTTLIDAQGWVGRDINKFWWKLESELGDEDHAELQALYSRAWLPYFDWQVGIAQEFGDGPSVTSAVIGMQGLARQWFEVDLAALVAEDGDIAIRFEAEYDLLLTQRLVLQPRLELTAGSRDIDERALGSGMRSSSFGLRLRYELRREVAPYIGISWGRLYGGTRDIAESAGLEGSSATAVAGLRFWF